MVGAGPAGDAVAFGLRDGGFDGKITLIGGELERPYERPHLSKGYLRGTVQREDLALRPAEQYRDADIELALGHRVLEVEVERRVVRLEGGGAMGWDLLCMAMGSDARPLDGGLDLRELPAADELKRQIDDQTPLDIIGAGFIGCEVAAVAVEKGCDVRVFEALAQPMLRVVGPEVGAFLASVHRAHGVGLQLNANAPAPTKNTLVAIGSMPRTALAQRAGLQVDQGILVDQIGRTPVDGVFAAGDVTRFFHPLCDTHVRVEHFQTSQRQGFAVGRAMAGAGAPYAEVPWFWSDQYDLNLQYAGAGLTWDEIVVRGELGRPPFSVFYLSGGDVVGVLGVNDHHTVARARHAMQRRVALTRAQMEDPTFDLRRAGPA